MPINSTTFSGGNPLSIRMIGSGEYVKEMSSRLVEMFDDLQFEKEEQIRQDVEHDREDY